MEIFIIFKFVGSNVDFVDLEDKKKFYQLKKLHSERNYKEEELFAIYERFQFNINQLLTVKNHINFYKVQIVALFIKNFTQF